MVRAQLFIVNGSFEIPAIGAAGVSNLLVGAEPPGFGWTVTAGTVELLGQANFSVPGPAANGILFVDLNGTSPGTLSQAFVTTVGVTYQFSFSYANNYKWTNPGSPALATVRVFDTGSGTDLMVPLAISHGNSTIANLNWVTGNLTFVATSVSTTVRFTSNSPGSGGILLDDITTPGLPQTLYGITGPGDQLITINTTTGAGTLVGPLSTTINAPGLAFRANKLYAWDTVASRLRELDPATAAILNTIDIGVIGVGSGDLTFRSDGIGFLANPNSSLWSFDITVPSSTLITNTLAPGMPGLAFSPAGVLFGVIAGGTALYTIDSVTGAATLVGNTGIPFGSPTGLAFDASGKLYTSAGGNLHQIDPATGTATLIGAIGFANVSDITFGTSAVPPPPPPPPPPSPSGGLGEGDYPGSKGLAAGGTGEGTFGFGLNGGSRAITSRRAPILLGPTLDRTGGAMQYRVLNVTSSKTIQANNAGEQNALGWVLFAGLAIGMAALARALASRWACGLHSDKEARL